MTSLSHGRPTAKIPGPSVARLANYLTALRERAERGVTVISSADLAQAAGVNPLILRKDLSYVGGHGVRGVGYQVHKLIATVATALHSDAVQVVALAGVGSLGRALLAHTARDPRFAVNALFDDDPALVGTRLDVDGPVIAPLSEIARLGADGEPFDIGVIATGDHDAQPACDAFAAAGVQQILNVTPVSLTPQDGLSIRQIDLALELQLLSFAAAGNR
ncbi:redox-sensing transcriptional repressor Rex [Gordonia sp. X0973]|uniref:redox-sensing transcriptional repressor Rex n=1 Tax=Gordonia sp. X0973 TaxID=2742602 RepID=UPI000F51B0DF|nr:redox-sensing transcriptional repressor Rex [Gordonia sp. X0973]QKT08409.1 redox-sensing transcriptional repressor Rex [Gordonia sp. X0973]